VVGCAKVAHGMPRFATSGIRGQDLWDCSLRKDRDQVRSIGVSGEGEDEVALNELIYKGLFGNAFII